MSTHRYFDKICCVVLGFTILITAFFYHAERFGIQKASTMLGYESKLFDTSKVHTIDIVMDDWNEFVANCKSEEYHACSVVIDNEAYKNVAIRGKGNTSLTQVEAYGSNRYSFKIEFDRYDSTKTYYGLDKLCLNNIIQDNTYMKDYLAYQMMQETGVASPLCSYAYITVNGEDWGLYLAVEGVEESFLTRNYGSNYGELYKPDSMDMGGGRGNGEKFYMDEFSVNEDPENRNGFDMSDSQKPGEMPEGQKPGEMPGGQRPGEAAEGQKPDGMRGQKPEDMSGGAIHSGGDDVLLKYIDDNVQSYSNIFDNAKTDITENDKIRLINSLHHLSSGENLESTVDIDSVIRYFVVHNFVLNFDSYTGSMIHNYYLYEKDGQMQMIPWDYNLAFGGFASESGAENLINYPIDSPVWGGSSEDRPMIAWIFENKEYTELYHQYFDEFISDYFESGYFENKIDTTEALIAPYVEKDPTKFCTSEEFEKGVATLREFCLLRAESVRGQLEGTIGSTSDAQESGDLVDAGDLQISDMGTMNHGAGGGMDRPKGRDGIVSGDFAEQEIR